MLSTSNLAKLFIGMVRDKRRHQDSLWLSVFCVFLRRDQSQFYYEYDINNGANAFTALVSARTTREPHLQRWSNTTRAL